jgi:hypothetical protein
MAAGFNLLFAPFFAIYYGFAFLVLKKWRHFCLRDNKKVAFFQAFFLRFVAKRIAFSTK